MNKCTKGWPNAPSDVSPDAFEAFLAHVASCPFHEEALEAQEEDLRSKVRLARGLDPLGRILVGSELRRTVKTYDRIHALWEEAAKEKKRLFRRIYVSNRGDLIAGSGKFFICRKYEGNHRLEPEAGLQLWGVIDERRSIPDVLLGFFPLHGVKHTGEEQFLALENDYTVGLRVEQLSDKEFNIGFRCVGNEVLERERAEAMRNDNQAGSVTERTTSRFAWVTEQIQWVGHSLRWTTLWLRSLGWSLIRSRPLSFQSKVESIAVLAIAFFMVLTLALWIDLGLQLNAQSSSKPQPTMIPTSTNAKPPKAGRKQPRRASGETASRSDNPEKRNTPNQPEPGTVAPGESVNNDGASIPNDNSPGTELKPSANAEDDKTPIAWHFQSEPPLSASVDSVAVHSGFDAVLGKKLTAEMRKRYISIRPFNADTLKGNHVAVSWSIIRENTAVTVEATLTADGDSKVLSFRSAGNCPEQVCDEAVRTAVSGVFAVMRDLTHSE